MKEIEVRPEHATILEASQVVRELVASEDFYNNAFYNSRERSIAQHTTQAFLENSLFSLREDKVSYKKEGTGFQNFYKRGDYFQFGADIMAGPQLLSRDTIASMYTLNVFHTWSANLGKSISIALYSSEEKKLEEPVEFAKRMYKDWKVVPDDYQIQEDERLGVFKCKASQEGNELAVKFTKLLRNWTKKGTEFTYTLYERDYHQLWFQFPEVERNNKVFTPYVLSPLSSMNEIEKRLI